MDPAPEPADVEVIDATACVDADAVVAALEGIAPAWATVRVAVAAENETRVLALEALRNGEVLWSRTLTIAEGDCPSAPEAIAASTRAGLAGLVGPALGGGNDASPVSFEVGAGASAGLAAAPDLRLRTWLHALGDIGPCCLLVGPQVAAGVPVELGGGTASVVDLSLAVGWSTPLAGGRARASAGVSGGAILGGGLVGLARPAVSVGPSAAAWASGGLSLSRSLRADAFFEARLARAQLDAGADGTSWQEAWCRAGVGVTALFARPESAP